MHLQTCNPKEAVVDADRALRATDQRKWLCPHAHTKEYILLLPVETRVPLLQCGRALLTFLCFACLQRSAQPSTTLPWCSEQLGKSVCTTVRSNILFLRLGDKHISPQVAAGNSRFVEILLDLVEMSPPF